NQLNAMVLMAVVAVQAPKADSTSGAGTPRFCRRGGQLVSAMGEKMERSGPSAAEGGPGGRGQGTPPPVQIFMLDSALELAEIPAQKAIIEPTTIRHVLPKQVLRAGWITAL